MEREREREREKRENMGGRRGEKGRAKEMYQGWRCTDIYFDGI